MIQKQIFSGTVKNPHRGFFTRTLPFSRLKAENSPRHRGRKRQRTCRKKVFVSFKYEKEPK